MSDITEAAEWAEARALALFNEELTRDGAAANTVAVYRQAFARYIAAHEEPPVDPLEEIVGKLGAWTDPSAGAQRLRRLLTARGLKIVPEASHG